MRGAVRWRRTHWTPEALDTLSNEYKCTSMPSRARLCELGEALGVEPRKVRIWFQNQRQRGCPRVADSRRSVTPARSEVPALPMRGTVEDPVVEHLRVLVRHCLEVEGRAPDATDVSSMACLLHLDQAYVSLMVSHLLTRSASHTQSR